MSLRICLAGNPNSGKTTLFNALTGSRQRVGNFAGVTVESKEGRYVKDKNVIITDLPGLYSLKAGSPDEEAVLGYLKNSPPDVIINVIDGTRLERSLYLTSELASLNIPMVLAVNMCDDLEKNGINLSAARLSELTGVPAVKISAKKRRHISALMERAIKGAALPSPKFTSTDPADFYKKAAEDIKKVIVKGETRAEKITRRLDGALMHRFFGIPIFAAVILCIYFLSFRLGGGAGDEIGGWFSSLSEIAFDWLIQVGAAEWAADLISNAVIKGVGTVLSFLPQMLVLFTLLALMEESGYAARAAFNTDRLFRSFGLGGKSMLPMILSCGCAVTGIMAARIIESEKERRMTVFLAPFMPCGAKTAVFGWFAYNVFNGSALAAASMYFLSIFVCAAGGKILSLFKSFGGGEGVFALEIPTLRMPSVKDVFMVLYNKTKDFIVRAGTVIFAVSVILWLLMNTGMGGYTAGNAAESFLCDIGSVLKYLFRPLGFGSWQAAVAVLSGSLAKEAVIETLTVCAENPAELFSNGYAAYSFMAFVLLSPPCVSAIAAARRELGSAKQTFYMMAFQTGCAYTVSLIINFAGIIATRFSGLILSAVIGIIIFTALVAALIKIRRACPGRCAHCVREEKCRRK